MSSDNKLIKHINTIEDKELREELLNQLSGMFLEYNYHLYCVCIQLLGEDDCGIDVSMYS